MKIALVHDFLAQDGGAERVLKAFHDLWPDAPIFLLFCDKQKFPQFARADIRESFLARLPGGRTRYQWYLPLMPLATERHRLEGFDVVLSSTSAFAKGVLTSPETLHISYCHTPTRFLWSDTHEYVSHLPRPAIVKAVLPPMLSRLRLWDHASVGRVDQFIANSQTVHARIAKYYRRESDVMYPPVDTSLFRIAPVVGDYFISGARLVPYKRMDLVVNVFNRLRWPLKIFGTGPDEQKLRRMALSNIEFVGRVSDAQKAELMAGAQAFIHPQVEDLGITPIESMAAGRPVIAYGVGGVTETVVSGKTGVFFDMQSWESLFEAVMAFRHYDWNPEHIRAYAMQFSEERFKEQIRDYVNKQYTNLHHNQSSTISTRDS